MRKLINLTETLNHVPWVTLGKIQHWNPGRLLAQSRFVNLANPLPDLRIFSFSPSSTGQSPLWLAKQKKSASLYGPCIDFEILIFQIPKAALILKYLSFFQHTLFYQTTMYFFLCLEGCPPQTLPSSDWENHFYLVRMHNLHCFFEELESSSLRFTFLSVKEYEEMLVRQKQILRTTARHCYTHRWNY